MPSGSPSTLRPSAERAFRDSSKRRFFAPTRTMRIYGWMVKLSGRRRPWGGSSRASFQRLPWSVPPGVPILVTRPPKSSRVWPIVVVMLLSILALSLLLGCQPILVKPTPEAAACWTLMAEGPPHLASGRMAYDVVLVATPCDERAAERPIR